MMMMRGARSICSLPFFCLLSSSILFLHSTAAANGVPAASQQLLPVEPRRAHAPVLPLLLGAAHIPTLPARPAMLAPVCLPMLSPQDHPRPPPAGRPRSAPATSSCCPPCLATGCAAQMRCPPMCSTAL